MTTPELKTGIDARLIIESTPEEMYPVEVVTLDGSKHRLSSTLHTNHEFLAFADQVAALAEEIRNPPPPPIKEGDRVTIGLGFTSFPDREYEVLRLTETYAVLLASGPNARPYSAVACIKHLEHA